jgi:NADH:ubiquinone oxidoreductase subunit H
MIFILITLLKILSIVVPLLIAVAYFTIAERKSWVLYKDGEDQCGGFYGFITTTS